MGGRLGDGARDRARSSAASSCESVSWQSIFFLNVPVAVGAIVVDAVRGARVARRNRRARPSTCPACSTLTVGLAALVLALVEGNTWRWGSTRELALFAIAARRAWRASSSIEPRRRVPMVDFGFFRSRTFLGANIVAFIVSFAMLAMFFFLALYMQNILALLPAAGRACASCPRRLVIDRDGADRGPARRPRRPAPADDLRAAGRLRRAVLAVAHHGLERLRRRCCPASC